MNKYIFIVLIFIIRVGFSQSINKNNISELDTINNIYIPKNLKDCFKQMDLMFNDSIKKNIMNQSESKFRINSHFGFGMWIRNNWGLWGGSRLSLYFHKKKIWHPDDMSGIILTSYHRHINGKRIKLRSQVKYYKKYWKKANANKKFEAKTSNNKTINNIKLALSKADSISSISLSGYEKFPKKLKRFKSIKELNIERCPNMDFKKAINRITKYQNLEKISFFDNHKIDYPENIGKLNRIKTLWISGDSITKIPKTIIELNKLNELIISECPNIILDTLFKTIKEIKSLKELDLSENNLTSIPNSINELTQIKELWLDANKLTKISSGIKSLDNLEYLRLFDNEIKSIDFTKDDLLNLTNIDLCYNDFEVFPIELSNLENLERITMWYSNISKIPKDIKRMEKIKHLNLTNNKLNKIQIEFLKKELPQTEIDF